MSISNYPISNYLYQKPFLSPLGLDRDNSFVLWMILIFSVLLGGGLYYSGGNVALVSAVIYLAFAFLLSVLRIDFSLYLLLFSVMVFDQFAIPGFESFTKNIGFFNNLKEISYVPFFDAGVMNPFEIHLLFLCIALLLHISLRRDFELKPVAVWGAFLLFFSSLVFAFVHGIRGGGDFMVALWEVRALFYLCLMYVLVPQILDTKKQVTILFWVFIIGISFKALQGVVRFVDLGFTTGGYAVLTNHEDPAFLVTLFVLLIGLLLFNIEGKQRKWLLLGLLPLLLGFYVAQRRASYASLLVCLTALIIFLPTLKRIKFLKWFLPVLTGVVIYGFVFWNNTGTLGRPVQMIKTGLVAPDKQTHYQDYHSNLYRDKENYNLARTVINNPVVGTGFGKKYDQPIALVNIRFPLRDYIPHNQIYWILVKMGAVGFFIFWFFFNSFVAKGTQVFTRLKDPYLKVITLVIVLAVINQMVVSFYDLQLTYYRNMIYLGTLMGLLPVIQYIGLKKKSDNQNSNGPSDE